MKAEVRPPGAAGGGSKSNLAGRKRAIQRKTPPAPVKQEPVADDGNQVDESAEDAKKRRIIKMLTDGMQEIQRENEEKMQRLLSRVQAALWNRSRS